MANYKINLNQINKKVAKSKSFQKKISKKIDTLVQKEKQKLIAEFNAHPVTKEIEAGPTASNSSGTLGGYGNLFSFIGFRSGSQPVAPLRELISTVIKTNQIAKKIKVKEKGVELRYSVAVPSKSKIKSVTPMPWEGGSWADNVEVGMSNFSFYMYKKFGEGRSGWGLQADHELRMSIFQPKAYISEILNNFNNNLRKSIRKA